MTTAHRPVLAVTAVLTAGLLAAACAPVDQAAPTTGAHTAGQGDCTPAQLRTLKAGTLTFGTDQPVYAPWFTEDDPSNGKGFESALAYAIAGKLGYQQGQVSWARVPFTAAIQPGPKPYDVDLNEFSITEERRKAVDFSAPYYEVTQAVVAVKSSPAANAHSLADLHGVKLGAQVGTTSYDAAQQVQGQVAVFNNNDDAKQALSAGQVQALVVDLPTAFEITGAGEVKDAVIVGQLPGTGRAEQFGAVLDKGSPLTGCVSAAVEALRSEGTLGKLTTQWLSTNANAPVLK
ncbi:ABC transporter substrate-binding protein [Kutzneria viridogrisea]|uniref:Polar amino acid transport system substrate-binding protein n=1 Tax=Kutzneria viridogrisea TaxID=47990 RepID=A0ABR6B8F3_9PSEU|nr:polar amino acid transport system substrate-binding protein [Kutzneria viridogrisea]